MRRYKHRWDAGTWSVKPIVHATKQHNMRKIDDNNEDLAK